MPRVARLRMAGFAVVLLIVAFIVGGCAVPEGGRSDQLDRAGPVALRDSEGELVVSAYPYCRDNLAKIVGVTVELDGTPLWRITAKSSPGVTAFKLGETPTGFDTEIVGSGDLARVIGTNSKELIYVRLIMSDGHETQAVLPIGELGKVDPNTAYFRGSLRSRKVLGC